jgi:hypothetical protein
MSDYAPSPDFVSRVMKSVRDCQSMQQTPLIFRLLESSALRWLLSFSAVVLGFWNILRIYLTLFAPVVCR